MTLRTLSPALFADRLRQSGVQLRTGPFLTRLQTNISGLAHAVQFLYADSLVDDGGEFADFHVRVSTPAGLRRWWRPQARFFLDGDSPFEPLPLGAAMPLLEWGLNWCVATQANQYLIIHSAVTERGRRALILPAPPGVGKSTLCAALVHRGWRLLSDEFALVRPEDAHLVPLPRPISLKEDSIRVIRDFAPGAALGPVAKDTSKGTVAHVRPPADSVARSQETALPGWIVFPAYQRGTPQELRALPKSRALVRLAENSFNYALLGAQGFETLASLVDRSECYEFRYHDLYEAMRVLGELRAP